MICSICSPPRIASAVDFWEYCSLEHFFDDYSEQIMTSYENVLGKHHKYFSIDGEEWPPRGIALFEKENLVIFATIGVSLIPQPRVELFVENPSEYRRMEWAMAFDKQLVEKIGLQAIGEYISFKVAAPWNELCWFGHGHTVDCDLVEKLSKKHFPVVALLKNLVNAPKVILPQFREDPLNLLWAIPLSENMWNKLRKDSEQAIEHLAQTKEWFFA